MTRIGKQVVTLALAAAMAMGGDVKAQLYVDNLCTACAPTVQDWFASVAIWHKRGGQASGGSRAECRRIAPTHGPAVRVQRVSNADSPHQHPVERAGGLRQNGASTVSQRHRIWTGRHPGRMAHPMARRRCSCLQHGICTTGSVSTRIPTCQPGVQTVGMSSRAEQVQRRSKRRDEAKCISRSNLARWASPSSSVCLRHCCFSASSSDLF